MAKVVLCTECKGEGTIAEGAPEGEFGYFRRPICKTCKGSGRLLENIMHKLFVPLRTGLDGSGKDGDWSR
ncbi:MAG TPA: hypothetical protein ENH82_07415 [bacterium]|nr:hypothetical protein [bacterium]